MPDYQPNSNFCFVCGLKNEAGLKLRFENIEAGHVRVQARVCDKHQGYPGIVHGGIVAAMLDEVMGRSIMSGTSETRLMFTAKMELKYRMSVPLNTDIQIRGWVVKDKGRVAQVEGEVVLPDGTVAVEGSATLVAIPADEIQKMEGNETLGWRIYTDEEYKNSIT
ncbi:MAG: PaaI family thioesterase [Anaerolineae bacterium]|nr:PaaI family thioesterase [Anaerolineae bacterium]